METFKALVLDQEAGALRAEIRPISREALPQGDVTVSVAYSSLNYKDGLAVTGKGKIIRGRYPFVPGIDLAGRVETSESPFFKPGDPVLLTGWGLGEEHWGGYAERARVRSEWLVPLPEGLDLKEAMAIGTAGFTAMLAVMALEAHGLTTEAHPVLVTGASGGVGSTAVALLARAGYRVAAVTGKADAHAFLRRLGAAEIIPREALSGGPARPLDSARWAGAVDPVGGDTLAALLSQVERHGSVASCGLAGGPQLKTTVYPFILRGVNLLGIDSNTCPQAQRAQAWARLARELPKAALALMTHTISLEEVPLYSEEIVSGRIRGRVVVQVGG